MAHITGGGFYDNIPRVLPTGTGAVIERRMWNPPAIFSYIQSVGNIADHEIYRTLNMGIGMVLIVPREQAVAVTDALNTAGESAVLLGEVVRGSHEVKIV